jgi:hypothetical protein
VKWIKKTQHKVNVVWFLNDDIKNRKNDDDDKEKKYDKVFKI